MPPMPPPRPGPSSERTRIAALILVAIVGVALYFVGQAIVSHNAMQNCLDSGRRDCDQRTP